MSKAFTREDDIEAPAVFRPARPSAVHLTEQGAEMLRRELDDLVNWRTGVSDPNRERRIRELQQKLGAAVIIKTPAGQNELVRFGSEVTVRSASDGEESHYRIVGPAEADPARGWINVGSPLARALLNHKTGDRVRFTYPAGEDTLEIIALG